MEDILRENGEVLKKGIVTAEGDIEFLSEEGEEAKALGGGA